MSIDLPRTIDVCRQMDCNSNQYRSTSARHSIVMDTTGNSGLAEFRKNERLGLQLDVSRMVALVFKRMNTYEDEQYGLNKRQTNGGRAMVHIKQFLLSTSNDLTNSFNHIKGRRMTVLIPEYIQIQTTTTCTIIKLQN